MEKPFNARGVEEAKVVKVIETKSVKGDGTPENQHRFVRQYWSFEGEILAESDPMFQD